MAAFPKEALFLGFDSSTQSLKATALDSELRVVAAESIQFDSALPHYGTRDGVHRDPSDSARITAPPQMWAEALEVVLDKLKQSSFPFQRVAAVSGSGQQHGSVYWKRGAREKLRRLKSTESLVSQLRGAFSIATSPVWMDSSTSKQCREIERSVGGPAAMAALTGSRAYERFTGPQIRKMSQDHATQFDDTERISLVSSFGASILIGDYAAIDHSDGAGMNLMDLRKREWSRKAVEATVAGLEEKLGPLAAPHSVAGAIHPFFVKRYGFDPTCAVVMWSGDNPCSLAGLALSRPGDLAISLGTSDTVFGVVTEPTPGLEGHVFPNPVDPASYMAMLCYKNGSLARQEIRDRCAGGSWEKFNQLLGETPSLNGGQMGFYYRDHEILPPLPVGTHRFQAREAETGFTDPVPVAAFDGPTEVRALVEGQLAAMRGHAERMGMPSPPERIIATGGGSANRQLLEHAASIFGCNVYTAQRTDSASLGAALRAAHGWLCHSRGEFVPFAEVLKGGAEGSAVQIDLAASASSSDLQHRYGKLTALRMSLEQKLLDQYSPKAHPN